MSENSTSVNKLTYDLNYEILENFIGVVTVKGYRSVNENGEDGYYILTDPGKSNKKYWVPKSKFDAIYSRVEHLLKITDEDLENLVEQFIFKKIDNRTIMGTAILKTGFRIYAMASSVNSEDKDTSIGKQLCKERLFIKLRSYLGFVAQWGIHGLKGTPVIKSESKYIDLTDLDGLDI
jgi:hypothetical protein